jgi:hypothetical protein
MGSLGQVPKLVPQTPRKLDLALIRKEEAHDQAQQSGLAGSVRT